MTSTNYNIGLRERNSSRVLKPPGGGASDVLGLSANQESTPSRSAKQAQNKCSISDCLVQDSSITSITKTTENQNIPIEVVNENGVNGNVNEEKETSCPPPTSQGMPQRVRVPPGGFSSGLW